MSDETGAPDNQNQGQDQSTNQPTTVDELPEWAREKLTKANNEAANYRVKAREAKEEADREAEAKYADKIQSLEDTKAQADLVSNKYQIAIESKVPVEQIDDFVGALNGSNEAELRDSAKKVQSLMATKPQADEPVDDSQGQGGGENSMSLNGDPLMNMINNKLGIQPNQ